MSPLTEDVLARCEPALREAVTSGASESRVAARIREIAGEDFFGLVVATAQLQRKAVAKFGEGLWWATDRALQQASARLVADVKAQWFGREHVQDLCCGVGGDALAFAARGEVTGVDQDLGLIAMARENARLNSPATSGHRFICANVESLTLDASSEVHIDPDRRDGTQRKTRPEDYSPDWEFVADLLRRCQGVLVKLAPAAELRDHPDHLRVWTSLSGSVREQSLATGTVAARARELHAIHADSTRAAVVINNQAVATFDSGDHDHRCECTDRPGEFMVDPDAAIRAAGLTSAFAHHFGLRSIGEPSGFLTGDSANVEALATCERVLWHGSCDDRKLRRTLRELNAFPKRVKTRAVSHDANQLERRYRTCGERPMSLWIGRVGKRNYAALTAS
ncbi:MAG: class I SAM-dependent methyltransferase [Planctomycetota bacterium]